MTPLSAAGRKVFALRILSSLCFDSFRLPRSHVVLARNDAWNLVMLSEAKYFMILAARIFVICKQDF